MNIIIAISMLGFCIGGLIGSSIAMRMHRKIMDNALVLLQKADRSSEECDATLNKAIAAHNQVKALLNELRKYKEN